MIEWNPALENILKKEGECAESLYWLHNKASILAGRRNDCLQIPVIILSSVTGFLSASTTMVPQQALGGISLLVGILGTINAYYKFAQRSQLHSTTASLYMKLYKHLETELALPVNQRTNAEKLLTDLREKMARISELAPPIPESIIKKYKAEFKHSVAHKPLIANGLDEIIIFKQEDVPIEPIRPIVRIVM